MEESQIVTMIELIRLGINNDRLLDDVLIVFLRLQMRILPLQFRS